jgi:ribosomal protein S27E
MDNHQHQQQQSTASTTSTTSTDNQQQSIVICDYCSQILESPVLLPCEHTICFSHFKPNVVCAFCKENHGNFYTVLKKLDGLIGKLRSAKQSYATTLSKLIQYEGVKFNPLESINSYFKIIREEIKSHKDKTLKHLSNLIEEKNKEILNNLTAMEQQ